MVKYLHLLKYPTNKFNSEILTVRILNFMGKIFTACKKANLQVLHFVDINFRG